MKGEAQKSDNPESEPSGVDRKDGLANFQFPVSSLGACPILIYFVSDTWYRRSATRNTQRSGALPIVAPA